MVKSLFLTETIVQEIKNAWESKSNLISANKNIEDNPIIKKAETIFISSIASSKYEIEYTLQLNIKESIKKFNSLLKQNNIEELQYTDTQFPSINKIDLIIENFGIKENRRQIISEATNLKKLLTLNNKIIQIINDFFETIDIESVIEIVLKEMYFIGASFWYINLKDGVSLDHIDFSMIRPRFKQRGDLYTLDGWNITNNGNVLKKLKLEDVLVFNNMSTIEYPGHGVLESIYGLVRILDEDLTNLQLQRATRSGIKLLHYPDLAAINRKTPLTSDEMKEYKKFNRLNRNSVKTDYYSNGVWKIDVLKADDTIGNIEDVEFLVNMLEMGLIVPHGLIDSGKSVNRNTLDAQIAYYVTIAYSVANDISNKLTYLVRNYLKDSLITKNSVSIKWNYTEPQSLLDKAKMMAYLKNQFIQMPMYKLVTDVMKWDWDSFLVGLKKDAEYYAILDTLPDQQKQVQAPKDLVDPNNTNNNLTKKQ